VDCSYCLLQPRDFCERRVDAIAGRARLLQVDRTLDSLFRDV
jgi:hypothetical protein